MRLTDFLQDVGHYIMYYPTIAKLCGGVGPGILFMRLLYWHEKGSDPDGWIYKTRLEIEDETALSRWEQETARQNLRERGFLYETFRDMPRKLYYRLDLEAVNKVWESSVGLHKEGFPPTVEDAEILHKEEKPLSLRRKNHLHEGGKTTCNKVGKPPAYTKEVKTENTAKEETDPPEKANAFSTPTASAVDASVPAPRPRTRKPKKPKDLPTYDPDGYQAFIDAYPCHKDLDKAVSAWDWLKPDKDLQTVILDDIANRKANDQKWIEGYIVYPCRYLRDRRWRDDITPMIRASRIRASPTHQGIKDWLDDKQTHVEGNSCKSTSFLSLPS